MSTGYKVSGKTRCEHMIQTERDKDEVRDTKLTFYQAACSLPHHSHNPYRAV